LTSIQKKKEEEEEKTISRTPSIENTLKLKHLNAEEKKNINQYRNLHIVQ